MITVMAAEEEDTDDDRVSRISYSISGLFVISFADRFTMITYIMLLPYFLDNPKGVILLVFVNEIIVMKHVREDMNSGAIVVHIYIEK